MACIRRPSGSELALHRRAASRRGAAGRGGGPVQDLPAALLGQGSQLGVRVHDSRLPGAAEEGYVVEAVSVGPATFRVESVRARILRQRLRFALRRQWLL